MSLFGKKTEEKKVETAKPVAAKAAAPKAVAPKAAPVKAGGGKTLTGIVVSTKMKDTIVVKVDRFVKVPKYERFMKISKKFKAHDLGNTKKEGDKVTIVECKPISRDKNFIVAA